MASIFARTKSGGNLQFPIFNFHSAACSRVPPSVTVCSMSETETIAPILHACTGCGAMLDVSGEQPLALVQCPTCGTAQRVRKQFGQYELQEVLGAGGMGAVYKAIDVNLNRPVAI